VTRPEAVAATSKRTASLRCRWAEAASSGDRLGGTARSRVRRRTSWSTSRSVLVSLLPRGRDARAGVECTLRIISPESLARLVSDGFAILSRRASPLLYAKRSMHRPHRGRVDPSWCEHSLMAETGRRDALPTPGIGSRTVGVSRTASVCSAFGYSDRIRYSGRPRRQRSGPKAPGPL